MNVPRASVDAALLQLLAQAYPFNYTSMHFRQWSGFDPANQPALFLRRPFEMVSQPRSGLSKYELKYDCYIYFRVDSNDETSNPYIQADAIVDAIDKVLQPIPAYGGRQSLQLVNGGKPLVDNAYIDGKIGLADGVDDGQGVILIPIVCVTGA